MPDTKPKADELLELVNDTIEDYSKRDTVFDELERLYFLELDKEDREETEGVEVVRLPYAANAVDLVQDLLADADLTIAVPASADKPTAKQLADVAEKYLLSVLHQSEKAQKQSLLARAAWLVAIRGCLAGRVMGIDSWMEKTDEEDTWRAGQRVPLLLQLRDPRYVYPSFGLDGLSYIVEKRERTVKDLRRSLGDDMLPGKKLADRVSWTEYWDDTWFCYWADGKVVSLAAGAGPWPHRYGGIPYSFEFARQTGRTDPDKRVRPLLKTVQPVIERLALLDSAEATFIMNYTGDSLLVYSEDDIELDLRTGAVNYLGPADKVEWLHASRQPLELEMAHNKYSAQLQKGTFPDSVYGMDPGRVMAGYALNLLNQSGQMRVRPLISCVENFLGELLEHSLMISEHYLADLLGGPIPFHLVHDTETEEGVQARVRDEQTLDAKQLGGWYLVEVSLGEIMPADEQANLILALRSREPGPDGRPLLSWETAVEKWGLSTSPADERERIDREAAWGDPQVVALRRALYAAQIKQDLAEELLKLDIDPEEVLAQGAGAAAPAEPLPQAMPAGLPPQVAPPQVTGQMMPQPMAGAEEEMGPPPPPMREKPYY